MVVRGAASISDSDVWPFMMNNFADTSKKASWLHQVNILTSGDSQFEFEIRNTLPAPGCFTQMSDVASENGFPIVKAKTTIVSGTELVYADVNTVIVSGTKLVWLFTGLDSAGPWDSLDEWQFL